MFIIVFSTGVAWATEPSGQVPKNSCDPYTFTDVFNSESASERRLEIESADHLYHNSFKHSELLWVSKNSSFNGKATLRTKGSYLSLSKVASLLITHLPQLKTEDFSRNLTKYFKGRFNSSLNQVQHLMLSYVESKSPIQRPLFEGIFQRLELSRDAITTREMQELWRVVALRHSPKFQEVLMLMSEKSNMDIVPDLFNEIAEPMTHSNLYGLTQIEIDLLYLEFSRVVGVLTPKAMQHRFNLKSETLANAVKTGSQKIREQYPFKDQYDRELYNAYIKVLMRKYSDSNWMKEFEMENPFEETFPQTIFRR